MMSRSQHCNVVAGHSRRPPGQPWFRFGFAAFLVFEVLLLLEGFLRFANPADFRLPASSWTGSEWGDLVHQPSPLPGLDYELRPGVSKELPNGFHVLINSYGMRGDEPLPADAKEVYRIAALGDSYTFGYGVEEEKPYPVVLENALNASRAAQPVRFDVLNFGVSGYSTREEALVLEHKALAWNPKIVVLGYFLNDPDQVPFQPLQLLYKDPAWWQYLHVGRTVAAVGFQWNIHRYGGGDYFEALHAGGSESWRSVRQAFRDIRALTEPREIEVMVAIFPFTPAESWSGYRYGNLHSKVSGAARDAGFGVVDLLERFATREPRHLVVSENDNHPSPLAHCLAAEALLDHVAESVPTFFQESPQVDCSERILSETAPIESLFPPSAAPPR